MSEWPDAAPSRRVPDHHRRAEAKGWPWLGVFCAPCRQTTLLPFKLLRTKTRECELAEIKRRLYCQRCGFPPDRVTLTRMIYPKPQGAPTTQDWEFPACGLS